MEQNYPDWLFTREGQLHHFWCVFYSKFLSLSLERIALIKFTWNALPKNKAETWGVKKIRLNTNAYSHHQASEWIGTIGHELTHENDYYQSTLPDFIIRFLENVKQKSKTFFLGYTHEKAYHSSKMEQKAFYNQNQINRFVSQYKPHELYDSVVLTMAEKRELLSENIKAFLKSNHTY